METFKTPIKSSKKTHLMRGPVNSSSAIKEVTCVVPPVVPSEVTSVVPFVGTSVVPL